VSEKIKLTEIDFRYTILKMFKDLDRLKESNRKLVSQIRKLFGHLDGCSHGYSDDLWINTEKLIDKTEGRKI